ncbi:hypothetical protein [Paraburkholderia sp.]|uniref:BspC domain-containing protein n=1 Tax=Paraburkholderia sp. TaxID=1926495 RepID=UPI0023999991|nr:hypothetical protein [Paraburkholderia sp.]MDE1179831.1 hypothetical protein [Paraburkholderia sp.]
MKVITAVSALLLICWTCHQAYADPQTDMPDEYDYLRRMHVPDAVANCVAAFDRWVRTASRYDSFMVPDRSALNATTVAGSTPGTAPVIALADADTSSPVDKTVGLRAFAKVRDKYRWVPVRATCGIADSEVVSVSLQPEEIVR